MEKYNIMTTNIKYEEGIPSEVEIVFRVENEKGMWDVKTIEFERKKETFKCAVCDGTVYKYCNGIHMFLCKAHCDTWDALVHVHGVKAATKIWKSMYRGAVNKSYFR